jgi:hypothetical protein
MLQGDFETEVGVVFCGKAGRGNRLPPKQGAFPENFLPGIFRGLRASATRPLDACESFRRQTVSRQNQILGATIPPTRHLYPC